LISDPFRITARERRSTRSDAYGAGTPDLHPVILCEAKP
jgi:hypothetical protein